MCECMIKVPLTVYSACCCMCSGQNFRLGIFLARLLLAKSVCQTEYCVFCQYLNQTVIVAIIWVGLLLGIVEFSGAGGIWRLGLGNWDWSTGESG